MIRSARSEARKATVSPMGSGQPNLPAGQIAGDEVVHHLRRIVLLEPVPGAAGEINGAGGDTVDQHVLRGQVQGQVL